MAHAHEYEAVTVVGRGPDQTPATLRKQIDEWTASAALAALVTEFGGSIPDLDLPERLAFLDAFSEEWDYRAKATSGGPAVERNQAVIVHFTPARNDLVLAAAAALGLVEPNAPMFTAYDHMLVNGALVRYSIWRMNYAGYLVRHGVEASAVAALTAYRRMALNDANPEVDEPTLLARYGLPPVQNEAEMMEVLLRREFDLGALEEVLDATTGQHQARFTVRATVRDGVAYALVAAPDPASGTRARTGDTMRFWASEVANLAPGDRVLSISSAIYGPFQHAAALQHLAIPYGAHVDTVSIDFDTIPPEPPRYEFTPSQYLQEVRSTIRAYRDLHASMPATPCTV